MDVPVLVTQGVIPVAFINLLPRFMSHVAEFSSLQHRQSSLQPVYGVVYDWPIPSANLIRPQIDGS